METKESVLENLTRRYQEAQKHAQTLVELNIRKAQAESDVQKLGQEPSATFTDTDSIAAFVTEWDQWKEAQKKLQLELATIEVEGHRVREVLESLLQGSQGDYPRFAVTVGDKWKVYLSTDNRIKVEKQTSNTRSLI